MSSLKTPVLIADVETGGINALENPPLTLSAVRTSDGATFNVKIKPIDGLTIQEEALKVTGIDVEDLRMNGISEEEAAREFFKFAGGGDHVFAGCNFPFDIKFINELYKRNGMPSPVSHRCVDLQTVAFLAHEKGLINLPSSKSGVLLLNLDVISSAFGVSRATELHDSLEDVLLTQKCIEEGISLLKNRNEDVETEGKTNLVVITTETSGVNPRKHALLRLTAKRMSDGAVFDSWVKPDQGSYGDKKHLAKTGIDTSKLISEAPAASDVLRKFSRFLSESGPHILSGCNVSFDVDFIEAGCRRHGIRPPFGGKRVDLQTVAFVAHECERINLSQKNGVVDLSFDSIAKACGVSRQRGVDREPTDIQIVHQCLTHCAGINFEKKCAALASGKSHNLTNDRDFRHEAQTP